MTKRFVLVAGNIGVGKTSLTDRLSSRLGWQAAYESVSDNPYLADFYADMPSWSFHLQVYFLGHRAEQHRRMVLSSVSAICDRSIYEDAHIFARALYQLGNMRERDYLAYRRLYQIVVQQLVAPDLLLYLEASVETLLARIRGRDRTIESGITADYLDLLNSFYAEWMGDLDLCPVLTIPADRLDFVRHPHHLDVIVERIQQKLAGKEVVVFD
ncbi:MAG: deoxynucleoside kinase [Anaerolineae bacterium]|jgi:deoxyadenosine/deoxycytidine kinase